MILTISEVVSSICTDGKFAGYPTTYIKLHGCNLSCKGCNKSNNKRKRMGVPTLLNFITKMGNEHIIITGGEPLLQESVFVLLYDLVDRGYKVLIETNGAVELEEDTYKRSFSYSMSLKCPSSRMEKSNKLDNLKKLMAQDEVRVLVRNIEDYLYAKDILDSKHYPTKAEVIFIPSNVEGKHCGADLSQWLLEDKLPRAKVSVPMKFLKPKS